MLGDITVADEIYIVCGYTDFRKGIPGLVSIIEDEYKVNPYTRKLFIFCGRRRDRIKLLIWEGDGFCLLYKLLCGEGSFKWPKNSNELKNISWREFEWLISGLKIEQKGVIKPAHIFPKITA